MSWIQALSQAQVARDMLRSIPERARKIVMDGDFGGTDLAQLSRTRCKNMYQHISMQYLPG